jgi:hypothetical protein
MYRSFIEEASHLYADALVNDKAEIPQLLVSMRWLGAC